MITIGTVFYCLKNEQKEHKNGNLGQFRQIGTNLGKLLLPYEGPVNKGLEKISKQLSKTALLTQSL